jgi:hypothetical protein
MLGLDVKETVLLVLSVVRCGSVAQHGPHHGPARCVVHLVMFAVYLFTVVVP